MNKFQKGRYILKYPEKYVGLKTPTYRSGWEHAFMRLCDEKWIISYFMNHHPHF